MLTSRSTVRGGVDPWRNHTYSAAAILVRGLRTWPSIHIYTPITVHTQRFFLTRFRVHFRPDLASHSDRLPMRLGADLGRSWGRLQPVWPRPGARLGAVFASLWPLRGHLGAILGPLGALLESSWGHLGRL